MSYFFSTPVDIDIVLEDADDRSTVDIKLEKNRKEKAPLYMDGESVKGAVTIRPKDGKRLEHTGIKVQFIGTIEMFFDRGTHYEFLSLGQELAAPGELQHPQTFDFNFKNVEKQYESYNGINVKLRYFVRVTVSRRMADVIREKDIWVYSYKVPPETNSSIKMDVGIEDCLHIEFEYSKSKYHLKDVIVGRIYFLLVRLKIKHMELSIIRRETTGAPPNQYNESETLVRFEIMDGSPSRGETIPIRLFLGGFDLTPTFREVNKKYSTRYYLSLVLIDEGIKEVQVIQWFVQPEARVEQFDKLCEVQSDKAVVEITSRFDGVVKKLHYQAEDMAQVGKPLCDIDIQGDVSPEDEALIAPVGNVESPSSSDRPSEPTTSDVLSQDRTHPPTRRKNTGESTSHARLATPAVRSLLKSLNLDISEVKGTGRDGRVLKEDVQAHTSTQTESPQQQHQGSTDPSTPSPTLSSTQTPPIEEEVTPLTPVQLAMYRTMTASLQIPHFLYTDEINLTPLETLRQKLQSSQQQTPPLKLSNLPFIVKAITLSPKSSTAHR
ncbi:hypothetical protein MMC25_001731 [Agyrium rufum]|nr:hypothetical protein [Agyrium rufum]